MIGNDEPETSLPGEIVAHADWYDYEAKYEPGGMDLVVPAPIDDATTARVRELAAEVYRAAACSGLARCDFFVTRRRRGAGQRAQHDPGVHRDERVREALRGDRAFPTRSSATGSSRLAVERYEREREYEF